MQKCFVGTGCENRYCRKAVPRSEEHTSELQSQSNLVCRLLLEKKNQEFHHVAGAQARLASVEVSPDGGERHVLLVETSLQPTVIGASSLDDLHCTAIGRVMRRT